MSFFASSSYKPQIRQEGFHLPSPGSPSAHSPPSPPPSATAAHFESSNSATIFMPQNFLPDAFRKYPAGSGDTGANSMDFGDELASMMANSPGPAGQHNGHGHHHQSSHERSTQSPNPSGDANYDDGYRPPHNIFDISAPLQHHQRSNSNGFPSHFSLPPTSHRSQDNGPLSQSSSLHNPSSLHHQQPVHDYGTTHNHFNSTLPALNSSMRFDPHPPGSSSHDLPPPSSFNYPAGVTQTDYRGQNRHSPSPIGTSRSRSRSRAPSIGPTRTTTRSRRHNSLSSTSPPPGRPSAIIIPGSHRHLNGNGNGVPVSPLSMHSLSSSSGWFMPPHGQHP
ncbi:hypothetical protein PILCRDRAFT_339631 [Piloderma croceum F 1598]|uniref:Uncharacterized protein n=1 Tax=Piloderma croceum (strain F 1598) TaxID=765440 RepID=A0A0C3G1C5_PILCF|nr:hypothetical protein PILCRDRAFT_339631 [Piloderma croceum F 1598]